MNLWTVLEISKNYAHLGWAVQEQMETLLSDESSPEEVADLNVNAVKMIVSFLEDIKDLAEQQGNKSLIREIDEVFDKVNDIFYTGEEK
jgi:hypothetical protein